MSVCFARLTETTSPHYEIWPGEERRRGHPSDDKRLGVAVSFKPIDWSAKESELNGNRIDVLWNGLTITEERKANILFTKPYLENRQIIVVTEKSPIKTKAELAGKVVGVQDGSSAVEAIQKDEATAKSIKELKKFGDNVTALMDTLCRAPGCTGGG